MFLFVSDAPLAVYTLSPPRTLATAARLLFQRLDQGRHRRPQRRPTTSQPMLATVSLEALLVVFLRLPSLSPLFFAAKLRPHSVAVVEDSRRSRSSATLISLKHRNMKHRFDFIGQLWSANFDNKLFCVSVHCLGATVVAVRFFCLVSILVLAPIIAPTAVRRYSISLVTVRPRWASHVSGRVCHR